MHTKKIIRILSALTISGLLTEYGVAEVKGDNKNVNILAGITGTSETERLSLNQKVEQAIDVDYLLARFDEYNDESYYGKDVATHNCSYQCCATVTCNNMR
ncbi:MAG: hypothetical protein FD149_791 [Rhodospirillaceae bacterium]|nr:MAG: hypothetical protein FD149_791 [Rhodospirillaceae bacterium]